METPVADSVMAEKQGWFFRTRTFLHRCWRGKTLCSEAFWLLLVAGTVAFYIANILAVLLLAMLTAGLKSMSPGAEDAGLTAVFVWTIASGIANGAFYVFTLVSVWRCAPNTEHRVIKVLVRTVVVIVAVLLVVGLVDGYFRGQELAEQHGIGIKAE